MRLFVAIDPDDAIRTRVARFLEDVRGFAPEARWVSPESLHVTLKFIGEQQEDKVELIKSALRTIQAAAFDLNFRGCGYFPTARSARIFWIGLEAEENLSSLAAAVDEGLGQCGIPKEEHKFNPHLTLARSRESRATRKEEISRSSFQQLQQKLEAIPCPELGRMTAREFSLYRSQLAPSGSRYTKLARFVLS